MTGAIVVLLNDVVHAGRDAVEGLPGILSQFGPAFAGCALGALTILARGSDRGLVGGTDVPSLRAAGGRAPGDSTIAPLRTAAAAITLAGGNSLGPEGPSVEVGANVAVAFNEAFLTEVKAETEAERKKQEAANKDLRLNMLAAGCASGIAAGFNAPIAGLFFAMESVRAGDRAQGPAMQFLAAVLAATVSQLGLGDNPAVNLDKVQFTPRDSLWELPLFLVLGIACGLVAAALKVTRKAAGQGFDWLAQQGVPRFAFPAIAGLLVAAVAMSGLEEVIYLGFANVNLVLQEVDGSARPPGAPLEGSGDYIQHLAGLVVAKVLLTAVCQASGQVGGVFAPSLFVGASLGGLMGRGLRDYAWPWPLVLGDIHAFSIPATYAIVGMSACLGTVCGVPLTSVVLLVELTGGVNYGVVLPTVAAVGTAVLVEELLMAEDGVISRQLQMGENGLWALARWLEWIMNSPSRLAARTKVAGTTKAGVATAPVEAAEDPDRRHQGVEHEVPDSQAVPVPVLRMSSAASQAYVAVDQGTYLRELVQQLSVGRVETAVVLDDDGRTPLGVVTLEQLERGRLEQGGGGLSAGDVMRAARPPCRVGTGTRSLDGQAGLVTPRVPLGRARKWLLNAGPAARLVVVGREEGAADGRRQRQLLGVASLADVDRAQRLAEAAQGLQ